jgi:hypothetical protein
MNKTNNNNNKGDYNKVRSNPWKYSISNFKTGKYSKSASFKLGWNKARAEQSGHKL